MGLAGLELLISGDSMVTKHKTSQELASSGQSRAVYVKAMEFWLIRFLHDLTPLAPALIVKHFFELFMSCPPMNRTFFVRK